MVFGFSPKSIPIILFTAVLLLPAIGQVGHCEEIFGTVTSIESGDTFTVTVEGRTELIRLEGIDCPETGQPFGDRAKQFTSRKTLNKKVRVEVIRPDSYNGTWAVVFTLDGNNLNRELLKAGLAWWYHKYSDDKSLGELETRARLKHRGLWDQMVPTAPWDFRRGYGVSR
jgi:endonuclease YncB( thermonuclease family)